MHTSIRVIHCSVLFTCLVCMPHHVRTPRVTGETAEAVGAWLLHVLLETVFVLIHTGLCECANYRMERKSRTG